MAIPKCGGGERGSVGLRPHLGLPVNKYQSIVSAKYFNRSVIKQTSAFEANILTTRMSWSRLHLKGTLPEILNAP